MGGGRERNRQKKTIKKELRHAYIRKGKMDTEKRVSGRLLKTAERMVSACPAQREREDPSDQAIETYTLFSVVCSSS